MAIPVAREPCLSPQFSSDVGSGTWEMGGVSNHGFTAGPRGRDRRRPRSIKEAW
jgi:hypothetical protein